MPKQTKKANKPEPWTGTKKDFILERSDMLPNEITSSAKDHGLDISLGTIYAVRSTARRQAKAKQGNASHSKNPKPAARARKKRRSRSPQRAPGRHAGSGSGDPKLASKVTRVGFGDYRVEMKAGREDLLKAVAAVIGLPRAIHVLEDEHLRAEQAMLQALKA